MKFEKRSGLKNKIGISTFAYSFAIGSRPYENVAPYCACLHIKDYEIKRYNGGGGLKISGACLGTGRLDLQKCIEKCREESGYNFNIILESWMEPCDTLAETLRKEDEWARAGIELLKSSLNS